MKIDLASFIARLQKGDMDAIVSCPILWFSGQANQSVFFSRLLRCSPLFKACVLDASLFEPAAARAQLATTFLGKQQFFWLSSLDECNAAALRSWTDLLESYCGPNRVAFFARAGAFKKPPAEWMEVVIPDKKEFTLVRQLAHLFAMPLDDEKIRLLEESLATQQTLSLDAATLLIDYASLAGESLPEFLDSCMCEVIIPDTPFFELATSFFARDIHRFLGIWRNLATWYGPQFWIALWSEQLFRAYFYVLARHKGLFAEAKRISWRLPFSFTQRDWKLYDPGSLRRAHRNLMILDHELKNGASEFGLDLFLVHFMKSQRGAIASARQ